MMGTGEWLLIAALVVGVMLSGFMLGALYGSEHREPEPATVMVKVRSCEWSNAIETCTERWWQEREERR